MDINLPTIFLQTISLILLIYILKRLLYQPVLDLLDARVRETHALIDKTEADRAQAENLLFDAKKQLADTKKETLDMRGKARVAAAKEREALLKKSEKDAEQLLAQTREELHYDMEKVKKSLKMFVADLSMNIAEKVLLRQVKPEDREEYIAYYTKEIEKHYEK